MIYTLTMNPAIDLFIETDTLQPGTVNRTNYDDIQPNGKGVNVSFILKHLGIDNIAMGYCAGFTGKYVVDSLEASGIQTQFISLPGKTRINVFTRVNETNSEYKLVNPGPTVDRQLQDHLLKQLSTLTKEDYLVISGSLPKGIDSQFILEIQKQLALQQVNVIIDTSDPIILEGLKYQPYLLKPNDDELKSWFNLPDQLLSEEKLIYYANELIKGGAKQILLSLGEKGCIYLNHQVIYKVNAPKGEVVNTACAGDTLLGSFIAQRLKNWKISDALAYASAAGSSTAFTEGLTNFKDIDDLLSQIKVTTIKEEK